MGNNRNIVGVHTNGTTIWLANFISGSSGSIHAYNFDGTRDSSKDLQNTVGYAPAGIWSDGTTMWALRQSDRTILAYVLATGERDSTKDFAEIADSGSPGELWSDGTIMWTRLSNSLLSYTLSTRQRTSSITTTTDELVTGISIGQDVLDANGGDIVVFDNNDVAARRTIPGLLDAKAVIVEIDINSGADDDLYYGWIFPPYLSTTRFNRLFHVSFGSSNAANIRFLADNIFVATGVNQNNQNTGRRITRIFLVN